MKYIYLFIVVIMLSACADKTAKAQSKFIIGGESKYGVDKSIETLSSQLKGKNYNIVSTFDHEKEALKLQKMLYPTKTINLYNSKIATKLVTCNPSISLEFPVRVSLYSKIDGSTYYAYTDPEYWSLKHNVKDNECLKLLVLLKNDLRDASEALNKGK